MPSSLQCLFHPPHHERLARLPCPTLSFHSPSSLRSAPSCHSTYTRCSLYCRALCRLLLIVVLSLALLHPVLAQSTIYATWGSVSSSPPPARCLTSLISAVGEPRLLLTGGRGSSGALSDVWIGTVVPRAASIAWQQQLYGNFTAQPGARYGHTSILDASGGVLLFGGVDASERYLDDIWSFSTATAAWAPVRYASFLRQPTSATPNIRTTQPSARAFTHWRPFTTTYGTLRGLPAALQTENVLAFLNSTASAHSGDTLNSLLLFGGRSSPGDVYSTSWSNQPLPATNLSDTSSFNEDFGDLWLYVYAADTWLRVGNATCVGEQTVCTDYRSVSSLSAQLPELLAKLMFETYAPSRPAALINRTIAMLNTTAWLSEMLYGVDQLLRSDPSPVENLPGSCTEECVEKAELASPTITIPPPQCVSGFSGVPVSSSGIVFCNSSAVGNVITQLRPNASEGAAMATHNASNGTSMWTFVWSFGGFGCASQGVDIFGVDSWDDSCFLQTLSVLSPSSLVWFTFNPPPQSNSQFANWPSPRAYASMAIDQSASLLWVYGGASTVGGGGWQYFNDLYVFDIDARAWVQVEIASIPPAAGIGASLVWIPATANTSANLFLYGGCDDTEYSSQLLVLQTSSTIKAANWQASGFGLQSAFAGVATSFTLTARSLLPNGSLSNETLPYAVGLASMFQIQLYYLVASGSSYPEGSVITPVDFGNGVYGVNYTATFGVTLDIGITFNGGGIPGVPFLAYLFPDQYTPANTILLGTNYSVVEKGSQTFVVAQLRDQFGNDLFQSPPTPLPSFSMWYHSAASTHAVNLPSCPDSSDAVLPLDGGGDTSGGKNDTNSTDGSGSIVQLYQLDVMPNDNRDGTFTLSYVVPPVDSYALYVLVDCEEIVKSPFAVTALNPLKLPVGLQAAFLALACVLGSVVLGIMVVLILYRNNRVVRAGSPFFLVLICLGVVLCVASVPVYAHPSSTNCRLFPFLLTTGYILALSALCSKSYRVALIFQARSLSSVALSDGAMVVPVVALLVCETIINLVWLVVSPLGYNTYADSSSSVLTYQACGGSHATAFVSASVAFNGLIALWGVYLALQIRHVPEAFGESKLMGAALYNLALVMAITIPLTWTASNTQSSHEDLIIPGVAILWCCFVVVAAVVAPKLYYILHPPPQHFFDGYTNGRGQMRPAKGDARGANEGEKADADATQRPAHPATASPANTTVSGSKWSPATIGRQPSVGNGSVKDEAARGSISFQPASSKRQSHLAAAPAANSPASTHALETSPLQLPLAMSSAPMERQLSSTAPMSPHQLQIDIQSPAPIESPAHVVIRLVSHEQQHIGVVDAAVDGAADVASTSQSTSSRTAQLPSHLSAQPIPSGRYTTSPAMQFSQSSASSPYLTSPTPLYAATSREIATLRPSLSVDDLGYPTARSATRLPPGPPLIASHSHTGSPAHSSASRGAAFGVPPLAPSSRHRVSISGQRPSQAASTADEARELDD